MKILLGCILLLWGTLTNAADTNTLYVKKNQKEFIVTLPSNPTTGYQWKVLKYDQSFLKLLTNKYIAPQTKLIGAGGQMQFTFALTPGKSYPSSTRMQFKYLRPWEPKSGTLQTVVVHFK